MKVQFDQKGVKDCICSQCPVQIRSECVKRKEKANKSVSLPKPQDTPRLYCSSGKSSCTDIDTGQMCICGSCPVWMLRSLSKAKPSMYFCRDGSAK